MTHDRARWHALHVLCGGMLVIVLDATIVNVALPAIEDDLGFSAAGLASACSRLPMAVTLTVLRPKRQSLPTSSLKWTVHAPYDESR